jgi:hypothetical protein
MAVFRNGKAISAPAPTPEMQIALSEIDCRSHSFRPLVRLGMQKGFHIEAVGKRHYRFNGKEGRFRIFKRGIAIAEGNSAGVMKWLLAQPNLREESK